MQAVTGSDASGDQWLETTSVQVELSVIRLANNVTNYNTLLWVPLGTKLKRVRLGAQLVFLFWLHRMLLTSDL